jgi:hypothetical protein
MKIKLIISVLFTMVILLTSCNAVSTETTTQSSSVFITSEVTNSKDFPGTFILGRPTTDTITLSLLSSVNAELFIQYGKARGIYDSQTSISSLQKDQPLQLKLTGLDNNTQYYYRICFRLLGEASFSTSQECLFHTQRAAGDSFVFTIDADPHFDSNADSEKLRLTFQNILNERPDFNIDLGDTFMNEKLNLQSYTQVANNYIDKRTYFGIFSNSVPLYLAIGNHDGESGGALNSTENNIAVWASKARELYYLNPSPDAFYSDDSINAPFVGLRGNYYAWEWGDALFVVLDPYWYSAIIKGSSGWDVSLGREQYNWLKSTLEKSTSKFKFVFAHNLIGGADMGSAGKSRGGAEAARFYEWGGQNTDGSWGFDKYRPGWGKPIHQLLVDNHVTIFFHGHDHFFAKQELDGVIYQECPQPSSRNDKNSADAYGYLNGVFMSSPGHIRITVSNNTVIVDYVKTYLSGEELTGHKNGEVAYSYTVNTK